MTHHRITLEDLAQELGVSVSTVSRGLNDHPGLPQETIARVKELARQRKYRPNLRAKALKSSRSGIIALIVPEINMFFVPELIYGVTSKAKDTGNSVMVFQSENQLEKEKEWLNYAINLPVDGILISISEETNDVDHLREADEFGIPLVLVDKVSRADDFLQVTVNDAQASCDAVAHLIEKGHQHILGLFGNEALTMTQKRKSGFRDAFRAAELGWDEDLLVSVDQILEIDTLLSDIFLRHPEISAIFCMSDELLVNTHHWLQKNNKRIPDDISVIAISDGFLPYYLFPNIAHVHHSGFEVGNNALELLADQLENGTTTKGIKTIRTKLFPMDSVRDIHLK